jgi:predicted methyltransferase
MIFRIRRAAPPYVAGRFDPQDSCAKRMGIVLACAVLAGAVTLWSPRSYGADIYDAAVQHTGRSAEDLKRDESEHPAEVLRLSGIKPGMKVGDVMAAGGYYSELLSYIVGSKGHVLLLNNTAYDNWSEGGWEKRLAGGRLPNVEHRTIDLEHIDLPDHSLDALWLMKTYHDFYWVDTDPKGTWPKMNAAVVLDQLTRVLKPGGIMLVEDHSAKPGTGSTVASSLHRIDEAYTVRDFEKRGFKLIGKSDLLRKPEDKRETVSYTPPGLGHTDRFLLVFRKNGG